MPTCGRDEAPNTKEGCRSLEKSNTGLVLGLRSFKEPSESALKPNEDDGLSSKMEAGVEPNSTTVRSRGDRLYLVMSSPAVVLTPSDRSFKSPLGVPVFAILAALDPS